MLSTTNTLFNSYSRVGIPASLVIAGLATSALQAVRVKRNRADVWEAAKRLDREGKRDALLTEPIQQELSGNISRPLTKGFLAHLAEKMRENEPENLVGAINTHAELVKSLWAKATAEGGCIAANYKATNSFALQPGYKESLVQDLAEANRLFQSVEAAPKVTSREEAIVLYQAIDAFKRHKIGRHGYAIGAQLQTQHGIGNHTGIPYSFFSQSGIFPRIEAINWQHGHQIGYSLRLALLPALAGLGLALLIRYHSQLGHGLMRARSLARF